MKPYNHKLKIILVGPEPGYPVVPDGFADHARGGGLGLFEGVVDRFEANPPSVVHAGLAAAVAGRPDVGIAAAALAIDRDAVFDGQPRRFGQRGIGRGADTHQHEIRREHPAIEGVHGAAPAGTVALETGQQTAGRQPHAVAGVLGTEECRDVGGDHAIHDPFGHFQDVDLETQRPTGGSHLETDVTATDDDDAFRAQPADIAGRAQVVDAGEVVSGDIDGTRCRAGGQQQLVVADGAAVVETHAARREIERGYPAAEAQLNVV